MLSYPQEVKMPKYKTMVIKELSRSIQKSITNILDLGCNDGMITLFLKKELRAKEAYGIDVNEKAILIAKRRGINTYLLDLNKMKFPFPSNFFDLVSCLEVIEHLINPDNMLKEVYRVLKRGGYFLLSTPNLAWWINRIVLVLGYQPYLTNCSLHYDVGKLWRPLKTGCTGGHLRVFTLGALKELLEVYGFHVLKVKATTLDVVPTWIRPLDMFIAKLRPSLGLDIILLAKK